ncbi:hypothetical protein [Jiella avicenniae]|uniref:NADH-quinone oxidoreductase subunit E n=1 Tax=Jiella avicenniae TaxID=2907202 RepID=A0A9X1P3C2_9HYPH|nr:hypothetical protein [Jiella avicenniae]MCE7029555.1 hypothetical protein [Jiella avicenniae]
MSADDAKTTESPAELDTDHPLVASRECSERLKGRQDALPTHRIADPLEEKHRAGAFDRDFRTLDYSKLSDDEAARERERQRRQREHSSWHPATAPERRPEAAPVQQAQFATFGGSMVSAQVVRGRSDERVPDMMPTLAPGTEPAPPAPERPRTIHAERRAKLAFSHPDGPTPAKDQRRLPPDPLAEKHKAEKFDRDFRTLDYRHLGKKTEKPRGGPRIEPDGILDKESLVADPAPAAEPVDPDPGSGAFSTPGAQAPLATIAQDGGVGTSSADAPPIGASAPHGLPAPRRGNPDDLTSIQGIGTAIERLLFERGLYHFDQIAGLTPPEVVWLEQELGFPGRIGEERWIEQARRLIEG